MLKLIDIKKDYKIADYNVHALKGVSVNFRKSELVSILGPSGCGKTTLLNIIGGLDKYTTGDLVIKDVSTKEYKDHDWDIYRNQSVGFVFQSYNLIPHLNVLQNVELALTVSGVSKSKRRAMAIEALEKVGLAEQLKKKPSQMSGGQCQRVAIARAIVNNPSIILADEPTGALDTQNSEQILDLLQEIADDRLVVMVTHNPDLAKRYSSRIIELLDGVVIADSNPYNGMPVVLTPVKPLAQPTAQDDGQKATDTAAPSADTAAPSIEKPLSGLLGLSDDEIAALAPAKLAALKRAALKRAKTEAAKQAKVDALATKKQTEKEEAQAANGTDRTAYMHVELLNREENAYVAELSPVSPSRYTRIRKKPKEKKPRTSMSVATAFALSGRNLWTKKFRTSLIAFAGSIGIIGIALVLSLTNGFTIYVAEIQTSTLINMPIMISNMSMDIDTTQLMNFQENMGEKFPTDNAVHPYNLEQSTGLNIGANLVTNEYIDYVNDVDKNLIHSIKYSYSFVPHLVTKSSKGKIVDVEVSSSTAIDSAMSYWNEMLDVDFMKTQYDVLAGRYPTSYDEIVLVVDQFNNIYTNVLEKLGYDLSVNEDGTYARIAFDDFLTENNHRTYTLLVNDNYYYADSADVGGVTKTVYRTHSLEEAYNGAAQNIDLKVVGVIRANKNVLLPFINGGLSYTSALTEHYIANCAASEIGATQAANLDYSVLTGADFSTDFSGLVSAISSFGVSEKTLVQTIKTSLTVETIYPLLQSFMTREKCAEMVAELSTKDTVNDMMGVVCDNFGISASTMKSMIAILVSTKLGLSEEAVDDLLNSGHETAMQTIGASVKPAIINIYPKSFADKDKVTAYLDEWNDTCDKNHASAMKVSYTDLAGTVSELLNWMMNIVSGVLIAFAAISLVVSSIMIAIITYISVLERTTEIGVLRAIGARKYDISNVFIAETSIIGFISGVMGIFLAWIIDFPINAYVYALAEGAPPNFAQLSWWHCLFLVALSVVLNVIAGLVPAIMASKKDPVVALRSNN